MALKGPTASPVGATAEVGTAGAGDWPQEDRKSMIKFVARARAPEEAEGGGTAVSIPASPPAAVGLQQPAAVKRGAPNAFTTLEKLVSKAALEDKDAQAQEKGHRSTVIDAAGLRSLHEEAHAHEKAALDEAIRKTSVLEAAKEVFQAPSARPSNLGKLPSSFPALRPASLLKSAQAAKAAGAMPSARKGAHSRPNSTHYGPLLAARLGDVAVMDETAGQEHQRGGRRVSSEPVEAELFWSAVGARAPGAKHAVAVQPKTRTIDGHIDYFISHAWQPSGSPAEPDMPTHAQRKAGALAEFASLRTAMGGGAGAAAMPGGLLPTPSRSSSARKQRYLGSQRTCFSEWRSRSCWVDKVCSIPIAGAAARAESLDPHELVRVTRAALHASQSFVAVMSMNYFNRLWCVFEWGAFLTKIGPHYRCIELAIPDSLQQPAVWPKFVDTVKTASLGHLRCGSEGDSIELWKELEEFVASPLGFHKLCQATALSLLAHNVLLTCTVNSKNFLATDRLRALEAACRELGFIELARVIHAARPRTWWYKAYNRVRKSHAEGQGGTDKDEQADHPLDRLRRLVDEKCERSTERRRGEKEVEPKAAGAWAMSHNLSSREVDAVVEAIRRVSAMPPESAGNSPDGIVKVSSSEIGNNLLSTLDFQNTSVHSAQSISIEAVSLQVPQLPSLEVPSLEVPSFEVPSLEKPAHPSQGLHVCPAGLPLFWQCVLGEELSEEDRVHVLLFCEAWRSYASRVNRWFDRQVAPRLDVWRARAFRSQGPVSDAFGHMATEVTGVLQGALQGKNISNDLKLRLQELASMRKSVRNRDSLQVRPLQLRSKSLIDRWLCSRYNSAGGPELAPHEEPGDRPQYFLSSRLPVRVSDYPWQTFVNVRLAQSEPWRRVTVPQRLGSDALFNALKHLAAGSGIANTSLDLVVPKALVQVKGATTSSATIALGLRALGAWRSAPQNASQMAAPAAAPAAAEAMRPWDEDDNQDGIDWSLWRVIDMEEAEKCLQQGANAPFLSQASPPISPSSRAYAFRPLSEPGRTRVSGPGQPRGRVTPAGPSVWAAVLMGGAATETRIRSLLPEKAVPSATPRQCLPPITALRDVAKKRHPGSEPSSREGGARSRSGRAEAGYSSALLRNGVGPSAGPADHFPAPRTPSPSSPRTSFRPSSVGRPSTTGSYSSPQAAPSLASTAPERFVLAVETEGGGLLDNHDAGSLRETLTRVDDWIRGADFGQWVPVGQAAADCGQPIDTVHGGSEPGRMQGSRKLPPCTQCSGIDVVALPLDGSMLRHIWTANSCSICLRCGHVVPVEAPLNEAAELDADAVLEVSTALHVAGHAHAVQRLTTQVLRVGPGQVLAASPSVGHGTDTAGPTQARSEVVHLTLSTSSASLGAAVAVAQEAQCNRSPDTDHVSASAGWTGGAFLRDADWVLDSLADTGLDILYVNKTKMISPETAIKELDEQRLLPRRDHVSPLVLWVELCYVLSHEYDPEVWVRACVEELELGAVLLPAAVATRRHAQRLRELVGVHSFRPGLDQEDEPRQVEWPLILHHVLMVRAQDVDAILGAVLSRSGMAVTKPADLYAMGAKALADFHDNIWQAMENEGGQVVDAFRMLRAEAIASTSHEQLVLRVIHELNHRRINGNNTSEGRIILRARRALRLMQVSTFLSDLLQQVKREGDRATFAEAIVEQANEDAEEEDSSESEDDEDAEFDDEDEDDDDEHMLQSNNRHVHVYKRESLDAGLKHLLMLTKVLGHAREYLNDYVILDKALEVLNVIVKTFSAATSNEIGNLRRRGRGPTASSDAGRLERLVLDRDFVTTAVRAIFRHEGRPSIGRNALAMLTYLGSSDALHKCGQRTIQELSSPPERVLTLARSAGKFSKAGHNAQLRMCIQLLSAVILTARDPSIFPEGRENEAAEPLVGIMRSHIGDHDIFFAGLSIIMPLTRVKEMCDELFHAGLTKALRSWLLRSAVGEISAFNAWQADRKHTDHAGGLMKGPSKRHTLMEVREQAAQGEEQCWALLTRLTKRSREQCLQLSELDLRTSVSQALREMKRIPRGSQWAEAVRFLTEMVPFDRATCQDLVSEDESLQLLLSELNKEKIAIALPLLQAIMDSARPEPTLDEEELAEEDNEDLTKSARGWLREHRGITGCFVAVENASTPVWAQAGLVRLVGDTFRFKSIGKKACADAVKEFNSFKEMSRSGGAEAIIKLMKACMNQTSIIRTCLYTLNNVFNAVRVADYALASNLTEVDGLMPCLVSILFANLSNKDVKRRSLAALRWIREVSPDMTGLMAACWNSTAQQALRGDSEDEADDEDDEDFFEKTSKRESGSIFDPNAVDRNRRRSSQSSRRSTLASMRRSSRESDVGSSGEVSACDPRRSSVTSSILGGGVGPGAEPSPSDLPADVLEFSALINVHWFDQTQGRCDVTVEDVALVLQQHIKNEEICCIALRGILNTDSYTLGERCYSIAGIECFYVIIKKIALAFPKGETIILAMKLLSAIIGGRPVEIYDYAEACATAIRHLLSCRTKATWTSESWEELLKALETLMKSGDGRICVNNLGVRDHFQEVWSTIQNAAEPPCKRIAQILGKLTEEVIESFDG